MSDQSASRLAQSLIRAHQSGKRIAVDDDARALTRDAAKQVMLDVAKGIGQSPAGWKVAVIDGTPAYAPMFAKDVQASGAHFPMIEEGYLIHDRLLRPAMVVVSRGGPKREVAPAAAAAAALAPPVAPAVSTLVTSAEDHMATC